MVEYVLLNSASAIKAFGMRIHQFILDLDWRAVLALACLVVLFAWWTRPRTRI